MKSLLGFCVGFFSSQVLCSGLVERAQSSAFIPNFQIHYAYDKGLSHVVWASLSWDFDEILSPERKIAAIQLERLEREAGRLRYEQELND